MRVNVASLPRHVQMKRVAPFLQTATLQLFGWLTVSVDYSDRCQAARRMRGSAATGSASCRGTAQSKFIGGSYWRADSLAGTQTLHGAVVATPSSCFISASRLFGFGAGPRRPPSFRRLFALWPVRNAGSQGKRIFCFPADVA